MRATIRHITGLFTLCILPAVTPAQPIADEELIHFSGMEGETIPAMFPRLGGEFVLPSNPATDQMEWILDELAAGETTSVAEVQAHFSSGFSAPDIANFMNNVLRPDFPNAVITDVITVTPVRMVVIMDGDSGPATSGFVQLDAEFTGSELITFFQVSNFGGSVQFPADMALDMQQAADKFFNMHPENGLFIGYVDNTGQCQPLVIRDPDTPRALGSIFKTWVLGGVADETAAGTIDRTDPVQLVAAERAAGGTINSVPLGTFFTVQEMATLMLGISDNTATDHLHELAGRGVIEDVVVDYGIADPDILIPFLNISEQFHVFTRFDLPTAQSYVNGTEMFQAQFLVTDIIPEGPSFPVNFPFFHESLLTDGTWRASPRDICKTLAGLRTTAETNGAFDLIDEAMSAGVAQPNIRNAWDRTWFKGGSLTSGATGDHVLTHAWLLENSGDFPPIVVVALANNPSGGIDGFDIQSITSRLVELAGDFVR